MHTTVGARLAPEIFRFGTFELNVRSGELRKRGIRVALQEQPLRILIALLERPGELVMREELCARLWPHGTFVDFEHSLNAAVRRLRVALGDEAEVPRFIETIQKRGYRLIAMNEPFPHPRSVAAIRWSPTFAGVDARPRDRLAVVPFAPVDAFSEGLTQETVTQLAQSCPSSIGVIARASVARAQREADGAVEIGRVLSADFVVEGSARRDGERVRITAQLIEAHEETHLWAKTFDRVMTDALALQTEVAEEIARAIADALSQRAPVNTGKQG
jgi:TolB-like protein/DNA-binding winged helix-turn-helix (wHTH) protein